MDIVTIDFETFYSTDYSLTNHTTEQYVRSPKFEVVGVAVKVNDAETDWYTGSDPGRFLRSLDYSKRAILCHNTAFDGAILAWKYNIRPRLWLDTLSMARPSHNVTVGGSLAALATYYKLGEKGTEVVQAKGKRREDFTAAEIKQYGNYCKNDVGLTYALFKKLAKGFPVQELMAIDQTIRMYTEPKIELDRELLAQHLENVQLHKQTLLDKLTTSLSEAGSPVSMLMSADKFAAYLTHLGVEPPRKISKTTGKETWAFSKTDKTMGELLEHPDPRVQAAVAARLGLKSTLEETRTQALLAVQERGRLPIMLNYYGAHTGRFSGGDKLNLQNLPARTDKTLRRALKAPEDHVLVSCDSSQIEARMVAWLAGQEDLLAAFRDKRDVYSEFASEVYGRKITKADTVERFVGKTCILGLGYGMGAAKFQRTLEIGQAGVSVKIDLDEAHRIVRLYRERNHKIVALWNKCQRMLNNLLIGTDGTIGPLPYSVEGVVLPNGFTFRYPALRTAPGGDGYEYISDARMFRRALKARVMGGSTDDVVWTKVYGGKVTENLVQALAAIVIREQMVEIGRFYHVTFQVHDEIIITAPEDAGEAAERRLVEVMSTPPKWAPTLPVACEAGRATNYGDT